MAETCTYCHGAQDITIWDGEEYGGTSVYVSCPACQGGGILTYRPRPDAERSKIALEAAVKAFENFRENGAI